MSEQLAVPLKDDNDSMVTWWLNCHVCHKGMGQVSSTRRVMRNSSPELCNDCQRIEPLAKAIARYVVEALKATP